MLECVVNISEGRDRALLDELDQACGTALLDRHSDPDHHRSVFTLHGEDAPRSLVAAAVDRLDLGPHRGVHPRIGVVDVVPFVPLGGSTMDDAVRARDDLGRWAAAELGVPGFRYGPERSLPDVRRNAFRGLAPDFGDPLPHPTAGAIALGARPVLVAYNVWLAAGADLATAKQVAAAVRGPSLRALGLDVGGRLQVSMNLISPTDLGPAAAFDLVATAAAAAGTAPDGAELVGLVPAAGLEGVPSHRWAELDLSADRTIEARLEARAAG